jgi:hypothetical protein
MKKPKSKWIDPVKDKAPRADTLNTGGDFQEFKDVMRKIIRKREEKPATPASR